MTERRTAVKRPPVSQAGLGPKPRLGQRTADLEEAPRLADRARGAEAQIEDEREDQVRVRTERPWRSLALMGLAIAGIGVSIYVTFLHYAHVAPVCSDTGAIDCKKVLTSPQSVFLGIPVPLYGLFFFVVMLVASVPRLWRTTIWWVPWAAPGNVGHRDRLRSQAHLRGAIRYPKPVPLVHGCSRPLVRDVRDHRDRLGGRNPRRHTA